MDKIPKDLMMKMFKETFILSECVLKKCNKEDKEFIESDINAKIKEDMDKMKTNADRKKIIKLFKSSPLSLNSSKCKYDKCGENLKNLIKIAIELIDIFNKALKIKSPKDVQLSIKKINEFIKKEEISVETYIKEYLTDLLNIKIYLKLLTIKVKEQNNKKPS